MLKDVENEIKNYVDKEADQLVKEQEYLNHHIRNGLQSIEWLMRQIDSRLIVMNDAINTFKGAWGIK